MGEHEKVSAREPTAEQRMARFEARTQLARLALCRAPFSGRGLSDRTIEALADSGIDAPERLLFMTEDAIGKIKGVGKAAMAEIRIYRQRFLPNVEHAI